MSGGGRVRVAADSLPFTGPRELGVCRGVKEDCNTIWREEVRIDMLAQC